MVYIWIHKIAEIMTPKRADNEGMEKVIAQTVLCGQIYDLLLCVTNISSGCSKPPMAFAESAPSLDMMEASCGGNLSVTGEFWIIRIHNFGAFIRI
jgi:hypothetical protein